MAWIEDYNERAEWLLGQIDSHRRNGVRPPRNLEIEAGWELHRLHNSVNADAIPTLSPRVAQGLRQFRR